MNLNKRLRVISKLAKSFDNQKWSVDYRNTEYRDNPTADAVIGDTFLGAYMVGPPQPGRGDLAASTAMYLALLDPETVLMLIDKLERK